MNNQAVLRFQCPTCEARRGYWCLRRGAAGWLGYLAKELHRSRVRRAHMIHRGFTGRAMTDEHGR